MKLTRLARIPPWEWPPDSGNTLLTVLGDRRADESQRLLAAGLAGEMVVINEDLVATLLSILGDATASVALRSQAALSLGPVLEQMDWDSYDDFPGLGVELPDDQPISEHTFHRIQQTLARPFISRKVSPRTCGATSWKPRYAHPRTGIGTRSVRRTPVRTEIGG